MNTSAFALLCSLCLILKVTVLLYLSWRQERSVSQHRSAVPAPFKDRISLEDHQKAADYTLAKQQFSRLSLALDAAVLCLWLFAGGLSWLEQLVSSWLPESSGLLTGIAVIAAFLLINLLLGLPTSLYATFVLEGRFGFNQTTFGTFCADTAKSITLAVILGTPVLTAILWLMEHYHDSLWWLWAWLLMLLFNLIMLFIYPRWLAPLFNTFTPLQEGELKTSVIKLLERFHFNAEAVFVMDGSKRSTHGNAYFTGFGRNKRVVFFDTLLDRMEAPQVKAILAHELGHFVLKHIPQLLAIASLKLLIGLWLLSVLLNAGWFYSAFTVTPQHYNALLLFAMILPVFTFFLTPLSNFFSRRYEYEADRFAAEHSDSEALISALLRLYSDNAATLTPDSWYSRWHESHPSASERIAHLRRSE